MRKLLTILIIMATAMIISSCQKELPEAIKNVEVNKGDQTPTPKPTPTPTPTPENPTLGDIPTEEDNPWPGY